MLVSGFRLRRPAVAGCLAALAGSLVVGAPTVAAASSWGDDHGGGLTASTILNGKSLSHTFTPASGGAPQSEPLSNPDDITRLGRDIFVGFQNGVQPQGQPSSSGNHDSTVVELTTSGQPVAQWDVQGKTDGLTADPWSGTVVATVNEDANSSLYTITPGPGGGVVQHYAYNEPLPHNGGTDAISVYDGQLLISASAPGTIGAVPAPSASFPAVYSVSLDAAHSVATVTPLFFDEDPATVANVGAQEGQTVKLALTDPDSNEVVPWWGPRFAGDFMLTSQGDVQQIFVDTRHATPRLSVLTLSQSVDDTAWPVGRDGTLFATDSTNDAVDAVTGDFPDGPVVAVTPCGNNLAPATCPDPSLGFTANYLGALNSWTGQITTLAVGGLAFVPQGGLLYVPSSRDEDGGSGGDGFSN